ncbi:class I SAM-dependent methyltransferase [Amycolatopsis suaedae]|uniref:Class I SAM-dependent methyltransferase n=1 Tax=Amycolatopsis suaedae TaxID=2510978 RepID=A0A4Q7JB24_9PSEU|nr:class I SAM-dependent methyltransferase [Amycolatopsis suaedae]RZQ64479.1 class I SAM-dependent methyltransferase [Amycolatopsis suaedae]
MVDRQYSDAELASFYDLVNPWHERGDSGFYLRLIMAAGSVLDVGCGTGLLLHRARQEGHTGRLTGVDPAEGMLAVARTRTDIEWVPGDASAISWTGGFDLAIMTGHAFQVLLTDDEIRTLFRRVRRALADGGRFAFETRNPAARAWERWTPEHVTEVTGPDGTVLRAWNEVERVEGEFVTFTGVFSGPWAEPRVSRSTLRFLTAARLDELLAETGFTVADRYGDWSGGPFTATSREIITIAR